MTENKGSLFIMAKGWMSAHGVVRYVDLPREGRQPLLPCTFLLGFLLFSCESFLEVNLPTSLVPQNLVFADDITATSAIKGLYVDLIAANGFSSGSNSSAATLAGLASDELHNYRSDVDYVGFERNSLQANNSAVFNLWNNAYKTIYDANSALEGLENSNGLTTTLRDQLKGEALFVRAYCHFYLVNLFGGIPVVTSTKYKANSKITRGSIDDVFSQIASDLQQARILLSESYQGAPDRIRVNKSTATALLARVALYTRDWVTAEAMSSIIIANTSVYQLATDLNAVFLASSKEAIWQLRLPGSLLKMYTTFEGYFFLIQSSNDLNYNVLNKDLVNAFEPGDLRKTNWIGSYFTGTETVYFPKKFKIKFGSDPAKESSTVFRLAEQYLIRAEAMAMQNKITDAISDVDVIRKRAGLPLIQGTKPNINRDDLLLAIESERRIELLTEGAHRWFDLKRTARVDAVIGPVKPEWSGSDELFPIPQSELLSNPYLVQNPNY